MGERVVLSLGAGVQSTTIGLLSAQGVLPKIDLAVFANTGWEPAAVYAHLDRFEREVLQPAGIPLRQVSAGNIRNDALDPTRRFASMPTFVRVPCRMRGLRNHGPKCKKCRGKGWSRGMVRRQCTSEYKLKVIKAAVRDLLGYPHPQPVPRGVFVEQWIGISKDEVERAKDSDVQYARTAFPLLDLGLTRRDCLRVLHQHGWTAVPKSACVGCPFHGNRQWREMRDNRPEEWADAVAFDHAIRKGAAAATAKGKALRGQMYLHSSLMPLDQAPIDRVTRAEHAASQLSLIDLAADLEAGVDVDGYDPEVGFAANGCGPFGCRTDGLVAAS